MKLGESQHLWLRRPLPIWKLAGALALVGGVAAGARSGDVGVVPLAAAGFFAALLPLAIGLSVLAVVRFRGCDVATVGARLRAALAVTDPAETAAPFLALLRIAAVLLGTYAAVMFSSHAFHRADLAAAMIAGVAVAAMGLGWFVGALIEPGLAALAARLGPRTWRVVPLATVGGSLLGAGAAAAVAIAVIAARMWGDLAAARLESPAAVLAVNAVLLAAVFARYAAFARPLRHAAVRSGDVFAALGIASVLAGAAGLGADPASCARAIATPGADLGIALGRSLTDYDGDGFSGFFGQGDCAALDERIFPGALDTPGDGVDQNCTGAQFDGARFAPPPPRFVDPGPLCPAGDCNVVLITIDSFRADQLEFLGGREVVMPTLERLAAEGAAFTEAYSPGAGTMTVVPAMLAGVFDSQLKMDPRRRGRIPVHPDVLLVSESLSRRGVATYAVLEHNMLDHLDQGFTDFSNPWRPEYVTTSTAAERVDRIVADIRRAAGGPFFLYAHLLEPHHDYLAHPGFDRFGDDDFGRYRSELAFTDSQIARVVAEIRASVRDRPTILVVAGDHGEGFGEHGIKFHNEGLYRTITHVPLVVWHSAGAIAPRRLPAPVTLLDVAPTILNLYGLAPQPQHVGTSLVGDLLGQGQLERRPIHHQAIYDEKGVYYNIVGLTRDRYRLLHDMRRQTFELYDVEADPGETANLADEASPTYVSLRDELYAWIERIGLSAGFVHRYWELRGS
jgi:arylsulfatase A-like enzyme